jgi:amino acid transporter
MFLTSFTAFICSFIVTLLNAVSTKAAASVMGMSTGVKVTVLVLIAGIGLVFFTSALAGEPINGRTENKVTTSLSFYNTSANVLDFPQALMSALWAYDGWNGLNYAAEEMRSTEDLVLVIKWSVPLVATLYFACNAAYIIALPSSVVSSSETVGVDLAESIAGVPGRVIMSLFVCISAFGAAMGTVFSGSRLIFSAARDGQLPSSFGVLNEITSTPIRALLLQWSLTCFYLIIGDFDVLVGVFGSATWTFYFLTVAGMMRIRARSSNPDAYYYRAPLVAPIVFCSASLSLVIIEFIARPISGLVAMSFTALGLPVYLAIGCSCKCLSRSGWRRITPEVTDAGNVQGVELLHDPALPPPL